MKNLVLLHFKIIRNLFCKLTFFDEIKTAFFILLAFIFLSSIYVGVYRVLSYLNHAAIIGPVLVNKVLTLIFLLSFMMVIFSSLVTSFNTLFMSKDVDWLMSMPISVRHIFTFKALETSFYASWMLLIVLVPFILAIGNVKASGAFFYIGVGFLLIPYFLLASLIGVLISLLLMRFLPSRKTRDVLVLVGIVFITGVCILMRLMQPERLVKPDGLEVVAQYLSYLNAPTAVYLPSWWICGGIFGLLSKSYSDFAMYAGLLYGSCIVLLIFVIFIAQKYYFIGWAEGKIGSGRTYPVRYVERSPFVAMFTKDVVTFLRNTAQWTQMLLLGALVIVYLFSIYKLPLDTVYLSNLVSFANLFLICFILSAIALRFIFPSVSLEGKSLWLLQSSPLSMTEFLKEKVVFGSIPVILAGFVMNLISNILLKTDLPVFLISLFVVFVISLGLSTLAVGFGAIFPKFKANDISRIESSPGGVFYMITAMFYLGLNASLIAMPLYSYYKFKLSGIHIQWQNLIWLSIFFAIVNLFVIIAPLFAGLKHLERIEI